MKAQGKAFFAEMDEQRGIPEHYLIAGVVFCKEPASAAQPDRAPQLLRELTSQT
jgi:hypothetical protein